ncbi:MAG: aspartate--tRNA ligase, partial [Planctomycetota bacterium]|nr:aspartate--tRNA ligase [Planctomycetota bacterium]
GQEVRNEWVLQVTGKVVHRGAENVNPKLATGEIEVRVRTFQVFSKAATLPFETDEYAKVNEEMRLKYRYLDLRRPQMQHNLQARHRILHAIRQTMNDLGFIEIETPILAKSTPEGARDYLVPSRVHWGRYYALPQSPQLFKQICMIGGCDRYYQIARCFRDEDLRADRQPEFTQLDIEMSFADPDDIFAVVEQCMAAAFRAGIGYELPVPFPRLPYREAMARYGCDKPDLRFGLWLQEVSDIVREAEFKIFRHVLAEGGIVKGIAIPGGAAFSRKELDVDLLEVAKPYGAKGLAWLKVEESGCSGAPAKFFTAGQLAALQQRLAAKTGDVMAFVADTPKVANASLAAIRNFLGRKLGLIKEGEFRFLWVTEFPAFEWNAEESRWEPAHHPFTAVHPEDVAMMMQADFGPASDLGKVRSAAYDLVLNGVELASGSVRVHDAEMQRKIFQILRLSPNSFNSSNDWIRE